MRHRVLEGISVIGSYVLDIIKKTMMLQRLKSVPHLIVLYYTDSDNNSFNGCGNNGSRDNEEKNTIWNGAMRTNLRKKSLLKSLKIAKLLVKTRWELLNHLVNSAVCIFNPKFTESLNSLFFT